MTPVKVVDASAIAAVLFGEPERDVVLAAIAGADLAGPRLLPIELGNVCLIKCRREPVRRAEFVDGLTLYENLQVHEQEIAPLGCLELAFKHSLSSYDASYLWLARELGAELVTLDKALARAAAG